MSTRTLAWLAFAGWTAPFLVLALTEALLGNRLRVFDTYLADGGLLISAGLFLAGVVGFILRLRMSPWTWGFWATGAASCLGALSLIALAVLGFQTEVSKHSEDGELIGFEEKRFWLGHQWTRFGYLDRQGTIVIPPRFDWGTSFRDGLAVVLWKGRWGAIDERGNWVISPEYEDVYPAISEGKLAVRRGNLWGFVDREGRLVIPHQFEWAKGFYEGRAVVKVRGKWGHIDGEGKIAVEPRFDRAEPFQEGLAPVNLGGEVQTIGFRGGLWGYVDRTGALVIEPKFLEAYGFKDGRAEVIDGEGPAVIDRSGRIVERQVEPGGREPPE